MGDARTKKCPYEHSIKKWETLTGKKAKVKAKTQGAQDAQPVGGQNGGWDKPVGLGSGGQLAMLVGGQAAPRMHAVAATLENKENNLTRLNELPEKIFEKVNNEISSHRFFQEAMNESVLTRESLARLEDTLSLLLLSNERVEAMIKTFQDFILEVSPAQAKEQIQELENELGD